MKNECQKNNKNTKSNCNSYRNNNTRTNKKKLIIFLFRNKLKENHSMVEWHWNEMAIGFIHWALVIQSVVVTLRKFFSPPTTSTPSLPNSLSPSFSLLSSTSFYTFRLQPFSILAIIFFLFLFICYIYIYTDTLTNENAFAYAKCLLLSSSSFPFLYTTVISTIWYTAALLMHKKIKPNGHKIIQIFHSWK